jgi:hypothetical protein
MIKIWEVGLPTKSWILIKVGFSWWSNMTSCIRMNLKCINMSKSGEVSPNWQRGYPKSKVDAYKVARKWDQWSNVSLDSFSELSIFCINLQIGHKI